MTDDHESKRRWLHQMFGDRTTKPAATDPSRGNVVPGEGNHPQPPSDRSDLREFVRELFDRAG